MNTSKQYHLYEELVDRTGNVVKSVKFGEYDTKEEAIHASYDWSHPDHSSIQLVLCKMACGCFEESCEVVVKSF